MITWSRVLAGKWRDPLVGSDLLFGTFFGIVYALLIALYEYANLRSGAPILGEFGLGQSQRLPRLRRHYCRAAVSARSAARSCSC